MSEEWKTAYQTMSKKHAAACARERMFKEILLKSIDAMTDVCSKYDSVILKAFGDAQLKIAEALKECGVAPGVIVKAKKACAKSAPPKVVTDLAVARAKAYRQSLIDDLAKSGVEIPGSVRPSST